jgi:hypothetical protein
MPLSRNVLWRILEPSSDSSVTAYGEPLTAKTLSSTTSWSHRSAHMMASATSWKWLPAMTVFCEP